MTTKAFYPPTAIVQLKEKLQAIKNTYGKFIATFAALTGVDVNVITSVIFLESAGEPDVISGAGAVGLMQLTPATASGMIFLAHRAKLIKPEMANYLKQVLGQRYVNIIKQSYPAAPVAGKTAITRQELFKPDLNIALGSLTLAVLISESDENGTLRLDKVISRYNRGYYSKANGNIADVLANAPTETRDYILKFVGVNSTMDLLVA